MHLSFFLKPLFIFSAISAASAVANDLVKRDDGPGAPGTQCYADPYNSLGNDWNKTYGTTEPQQLHMSWMDESNYARIQFATLDQIDKSVLVYWPKTKGHSKKQTKINGNDWTFVDGGAAKRELYLHNIKTDKLKAGTTYQYQVGSESSGKTVWSKKYEFHTASHSDEFSFIATGDIGACNAVAVSHMMNLAKTHKYDFVTVGGDQAYNMDDFEGTKGDEYLNFMQDLFAQVPYLGAVGNHEANYNFSHYKNRFNVVPYAESKFDNSMMYSINYKSLHLVSFSTEVYFEGSDNEILTAIHWLEQDLTEANKHRAERPWIVFLTHHPIYCSVDSTDCTSKAATIKSGPTNLNNETWGGIEDILLKHNVDVYLSGHVHNYERTYPVAHGNRTASNYHNAPSLFQLVIGNAGQPEGPTTFDNGPFPDWSAVRYGSYGFSTVTVSPTKMKFVHHQANVDGTLGKVIDRFELTKDKAHSKRNCIA